MKVLVRLKITGTAVLNVHSLFRVSGTGQCTGIISLQFFFGNALSNQNSTYWNDFSSSRLFAVSLVISDQIYFLREVYRIRSQLIMHGGRENYIFWHRGVMSCA